MKLADLFMETGGDTLSHTKLWSNIGFAVATIAFIRLNWVGEASSDVWWAYLACVAGSVTASKFLSLKYGGNAAAEGKS